MAVPLSSSSLLVSYRADAGLGVVGSVTKAWAWSWLSNGALFKNKIKYSQYTTNQVQSEYLKLEIMISYKFMLAYITNITKY